MSFTHLDSAGWARMVDATEKQPTVRSATARGFVRCAPEVVAALRDDAVPKGDVLAMARIAGIAGAKRTPELLPLAHVIGVHGAVVDVHVVDEGVEVVQEAVPGYVRSGHGEAVILHQAGDVLGVDGAKTRDLHGLVAGRGDLFQGRLDVVQRLGVLANGV